MKKLIKRYGDSLVITLSKEEQEIYDIKEGDIVDFELTKYKKEKKHE